MAFVKNNKAAQKFTDKMYQRNIRNKENHDKLVSTVVSKYGLGEDLTSD